MELNSGEYKNSQDFDTLAYHQKVISLDDNILCETLYEREQTKLDDEVLSYKNRLWSDIKKVCGGMISVDYLIMYQHIYLGESFRKICERFNVTHTAIHKRYRKVIQKLKFLYGIDNNKIPYKRREGSKL